MHSLDGLLADEGTEYWQFCFACADPADLKQRTDLYESAYAHIMGRCLRGHGRRLADGRPPVLRHHERARNVVFSRTLKTAEWASTTIAASDTAEQISKLTRGGDGNIVVWGGVGLWRSLMQLDSIDEFHLDLHPYVGEGTRLFDDVPSPIGSTWSPAPSSATGPSRCSTADTARSAGQGYPPRIAGSSVVATERVRPSTCAHRKPWARPQHDVDRSACREPSRSAAFSNHPTSSSSTRTTTSSPRPIPRHARRDLVRRPRRATSSRLPHPPPVEADSQLAMRISAPIRLQ